MKRTARAIAVTTLIAAGGVACGQAGEEGVTTILETSVTDADVQPLIVLDGEIQETRNMDELNALEIEHVEVIKGEAATNEYGDRGRNGVVKITTKS